LCTYIASAQNEIIKLRSEIEVESLPRIVTAFKDSFANSLGGADDRIHLVQTFGTSMQTISDSKAGVKGYFSLDSANKIKYEKRLLSDIEQIDQAKSLWIVSPQVLYQDDQNQIIPLVLIQTVGKSQEWTTTLAREYPIKDLYLILFDLKNRKLVDGTQKKLEKPKGQLTMSKKNATRFFIHLEQSKKYERDTKGNIFSHYQLFIKHDRLRDIQEFRIS
jgi:hypothetical protein